jgi:hypothetical protein
MFGKAQDVDPEIRARNRYIGFKVAMSRETFQLFIVAFHGSEYLDEDGKAVIRATIDAYNFDSAMTTHEERQNLMAPQEAQGNKSVTGGKPRLSLAQSYAAGLIGKILHR